MLVISNRVFLKQVMILTWMIGKEIFDLSMISEAS